ncbi:hypothetical protein DF18_34435, partial [Streptomyces rimosus]
MHQPEQRDLHREQGGLGVVGAVEQVRFAIEHGPQRTLQLPVEQLAHLVERLGEHRKGGGELPSHAGPLRALAGEQHAHPAAGRGAHRHIGDTPGVEVAAQRGDEFGPVPAGHCQPVAEVGAAGG